MSRAPDSRLVQLWGRLLSGGAASLGAHDLHRLAKHLGALAPGQLDRVRGLVSLQGLAAIEDLLANSTSFANTYAPLCRLAVTLVERLHGDDDAALVMPLVRLARTLRDHKLGDPDPIARRVLAIQEATGGSLEKAPIEALVAGAVCASDDLAVAWLRRALDAAVARFGEDAATTASVRVALGERLVSAGRAGEASDVFAAWVGHRETAHGATSLATARALLDMAQVLEGHPDGLAAARRAATIATALDPEGAETARAFEMLALALWRSGRLDEAEGPLVRALTIAQAHPDLAPNRGGIELALRRLRTDRKRRDAKGREWASAIAHAERVLGAEAGFLDLAVEALMEAGRIFGFPYAFTVTAQAGVLLARAGRIGEALALAGRELATTPAHWEPAAVFAAVAEWHLRRGDRAAAAAAVEEAARMAERAGPIYERGGAHPAVADLFEALTENGLHDLRSVAVAVLGPEARAVADWLEDGSHRATAPDQRLAEAADPEVVDILGRAGIDAACAAASCLEDTYVAVGSLVAVARAAAGEGRSGEADRVLRQALPLLERSFGEEGRRALIYHEDLRVAAAHGVGAAASSLLAGEAASRLAAAALARARALTDPFAGAALVVAGGAAATDPRLSSDLRSR